MIKLSKVTLINWMYFQKATFNLEGNTAIVGVNGTGKSTIIDAIQMLLLGYKASKFNANANAEKRTLQSYVRGAVNTEEKEFLRPGDVITYLAMEVELNGVKHVFGINIEYRYSASKLNDPKYFYVKNIDLDDNLFIKDNYPIAYHDFAKKMKNESEFVSFPALNQYQSRLKDILGLKDEKKYIQILSRAVGIKNITDCNTFMNEFVLDESNIDVSSIKNNILEMDKVGDTIEKNQVKANKLDSIVVLGDEIESKHKTLEKSYIKYDLANKILLENEIKRLENDNDELNNLKLDEENKKDILQEKQNDLFKQNVELNKMLEEISPDLSLKEKELSDIEKKHYQAKLNLNTFNTKCNNQIPSLLELRKYNNKQIDNFISYLKKEEFTTLTASQMFREFRSSAIELKDDYDELVIRYKDELSRIKNKLEELEVIIKKLENNQVTYNKKYTCFIDYIRQGLKDKYNKDIEVKFLCEYLDITDDTWRNAIEGYLGNQRFYIVVPNEYYKEALKLYDARKDYYSTRIINGTKLPSCDMKDNTLSAYVVASNLTALNYARYILNRVYCVNNIFELDNYEIAITKDCMLYQGYTTGRINPRNYEEQYIGASGIKNQLQMRNAQREELNKAANELLIEYSNNNSCKKELENQIRFASDILEKNELIESISLESVLFDKIESLNEEINFYKNEPRYLEISDKIARVEKELSDIKSDYSKVSSIIMYYGSMIGTNNKLIEERKNNISYYSNRLLNVDDSTLFVLNSELKMINITKTWTHELDSTNKSLSRKIDSLTVKLENDMKYVRDEFSLNVEPKYEFLFKFKEERNKINESIFKYKSKLVDLQKNTRQLFFTQFLSKLYNSIEKASKDISNLNHSLSLFVFGNDRYKIKMNITNNKDFETIYNYAKDYNADNSERGLFNFDEQDKAREKVQNLLNSYMFSDDIKLQNMIVDYRNYLYFDVEVDSPSGKKSLNKVIKTQSGGEVQVPFYILSGVAFQQTLDYNRNKDVLGIVLYDEAFDKMDSQRIHSMLEFYKDKLKLQLILATPGKLESLVDSIETIVAVVRDGENAVVREINHEIR